MKWKCVFLIFISLLILNGNVFSQTFSVNSIQDALSVLGFTETVDTLTTVVTIQLTIQSAVDLTSTNVISVTMQSGTPGTQGFTVNTVAGAVDNTTTVVTTILSFDPNIEGLFQDRLLVQFTGETISIPVVGYGSTVLFGDTDGSGTINASDGAENLRNAVGGTPIVAFNATRADVTNFAGVTAFDASLILQVAVGLKDQIDFPVVTGTFGVPAKAGAIAPEVYIDKNNVRDSDEDVIVPIYIKAEGVYAMNGDIRFDPLYLQYDGLYVSDQEIMKNTFLEDNVEDNVARIAIASLTSMDLDGDVLFLRFKKVRNDQLGGTITIERFYVNESLAEVSGFNLESKPILPFEFFYRSKLSKSI